MYFELLIILLWLAGFLTVLGAAAWVADKLPCWFANKDEHPCYCPCCGVQAECTDVYYYGMCRECAWRR